MTTLARCTERGCAWRWPTGDNRPCPLHQPDYTVWDSRLGDLAGLAPGDTAGDDNDGDW